MSSEDVTFDTWWSTYGIARSNQSSADIAPPRKASDMLGGGGGAGGAGGAVGAGDAVGADADSAFAPVLGTFPCTIPKDPTRKRGVASFGR